MWLMLQTITKYAPVYLFAHSMAIHFDVTKEENINRYLLDSHKWYIRIHAMELMMTVL